MRYLYIDNIDFTDVNGKTTKVKDMREYPDYELLMILKVKEDDMLDEIVTRPEIYGDGYEANSYALLDMNRIKLTENNFKLINELKIPVLE